MLTGLPPRAEVLDVGCGPGAQTLTLATLDTGTITAVDNHAPYLAELRAAAEQHGLADRIRAVEQDMTALDFPAASFDLIWSEGAIYIMGFETGLRAWRPLLRAGGFLAVTEADLARTRSRRQSSPHSGTRAIRPCRTSRPTSPAFAPPATGPLGTSRSLTRAGGPTTTARSRRDSRSSNCTTKVTKARARSSDMERREMALFRKYARYYGYVFYVMRRDS